MNKELAPYIAAIDKVKDDFVTAAGDLLKYPDEALFAMQALMKNDYAMNTANSNPKSVQLAMRNVAATGLTLNPAHAYAYLVPRDKAIVLDISYKGLIKIATDSGAILWARADTVCENDTFTYHGPAALPELTSDPFRDRGALIGAYCIAKTRDGDILTEVMPLEEIEKIRGKSDLYKSKKSGPWVEWFTQMVKKAVIKRASKTWPYTGHSGKLFEAIELANVSEGGYTLDDDQQQIKLAGTPTSGVWESIDPAMQEKLRQIAATVREYFEQDDIKGAHDYIERQALDNEQYTGLWTLLPSNMRSALKVAKSTVAKLEHAA